MGKKIIIFIMEIVLLGLLVFVVIFGKPTDSMPKTLTSVDSFGNQNNHQHCGGYYYALDGKILYGPVRYNRIAKISLDNIKQPNVLYTASGNLSPEQVSVLDGWIYFAVEDMGNEGETDLYRIRKDGSEETKLLDGGKDSGHYVLTEERILFLKNGSIYSMNLDGTNKIMLHLYAFGETGNTLVEFNIDNGWIYYSDATYLNRTKIDGSKTEKVRNLSGIGDYVVQNEEVFFVRIDDDDAKSLVKRTKNGKETTLAIGAYSNFHCLNIKGDWIYFSNENKVYKLEKSGKGEKQLIYRGKNNEEVYSILLYGDYIFISTNARDVYLKKDGTVIKIPRLT